MNRKASLSLSLAFLVASAVPIGAAVAQVAGNPQVRAGEVRIEAPGSSTLIRQTSSRGIIDWESFSIARDERIEFALPAASAITLNRVTGGSASLIDGQITSNGQVWLINPSGVLIGPSGSIYAHGFLASTLDIPDDQFLGGRYQFTSRAAGGRIDHQGAIRILEGGYALLAGAEVNSAGVIEARLGEIALTTGRSLTLDLIGDRLLGFIMDGTQTSSPDSASPITVSGRLQADGGRITLSARAATDVLRGVVNVSGVVEAQRVVERDGEIILDAGPTGSAFIGGQVSVSGRIERQGAGTMTVSGTLGVEGLFNPGPGRTVFSSEARFGSPSTEVSTDPTSILDLSASGLSDGRIALGPLSGSGTVLLGNNRLDVHVEGVQRTFAGSLRGSGARLYKYGDGTLSLTGLSDYGGGTWIVDGRLRVGGPYRSARPGTPGPVGTGLINADVSEDAQRAWERAIARELALAEERAARAAEALAAQKPTATEPILIVEQAEQALNASQSVSQQVSGSATVALTAPAPATAPAAPAPSAAEAGGAVAPGATGAASPTAPATSSSPATPATPAAAAPAPGTSSPGSGGAPPAAAAPTPAPAAPGAASAQASAPAVTAPPPSPVPAEKPPTPRDAADSGDKTLQAAAPSPPPQPASRPVRVSVQTVSVSPGLVATQIPVPPRPPAGAALEQRLPGTGNSARW